MAQRIFPFDDPTKHIFDPAKIEIVAGKARIKYGVGTSASTNYDFLIPANYNYDVDRVEVAEGFGQTKAAVIPAYFKLWVPINDAYDFNAMAGGGSLTAQVIGLGSTVNRVGNAAVMNGIGYIRFTSAGKVPSVGGYYCQYRWMVRISFNSVSAEVPLFMFQAAEGLNSGQYWCWKPQSGPSNPAGIYWGPNSNNATIRAYTAAGAGWVPIVGQTYEIEVYLGSGTYGTYGTGTPFFWLDGDYKSAEQSASSVPVVGADAGVFCIGTDPTQTRPTSITLHDFLFTWTSPNNNYNSPHGSINYTAPQYVPETAYTPGMNPITPVSNAISGITNVQSIVSFDHVINVPGPLDQIRYSFSRDNGATWLYWNGSSFVSSNGTISQTNSRSEVINSLPSLPAWINSTGNFKIRAYLYSANGAYQVKIDNLSISYTYSFSIYDTNNPDILTDEVFTVQDLTLLAETVIKTPPDNVKWQIQINGEDKYFNGVSWQNASGYTQANTIAEINAAIGTVITGAYGTGVKFRGFLHSETGSSTPEIDALVVDYDIDDQVPGLESSDPAIGKSDVAIDSQIIITFNEPIAPATVVAASFYVINENTGIPVPMDGPPSVVVGSGNRSFSLTPASDLPGGKIFTVHLTAVTDVVGNPFAGMTYQFSTVLTPPALVETATLYSFTFGPNGRPVEGMTISAELVKPGQISGVTSFIPAIKAFTTTGSSGSFSLPLIPSSHFEEETQYKLVFKYRDWEETYYVTIPDEPLVDLLNII